MKKLLAIIPAFLLFVACEPPASDTTIVPVKGLVYQCYATTQSTTEITTPTLQCEGTLYFCNVRTNATLYRYIDHTIVAKCNNGDYHFNVTDVKFTSKKDR